MRNDTRKYKIIKTSLKFDTSSKIHWGVDICLNTPKYLQSALYRYISNHKITNEKPT